MPRFHRVCYAHCPRGIAEGQRYMAVFEEPWRPPDPDAGRYTIAVEWNFRVTIRGDRY